MGLAFFGTSFAFGPTVVQSAYFSVQFGVVPHFFSMYARGDPCVGQVILRVVFFTPFGDVFAIFAFCCTFFQVGRGVKQYGGWGRLHFSRARFVPCVIKILVVIVSRE